MAMRTQDEILARAMALSAVGSDLCDDQVNDLVVYLDFDKARQLIDGYVRWADWKTETANPVDVIVAHLPLAWEKANDGQDTSVIRALNHFKASLWLAGDDVSWRDSDITNHGKPHLVRISERVGFDWRTADTRA